MSDTDNFGDDGPHFEAKPAGDNPDEWVVEFRDGFTDAGFGQLYGARFYGPFAQRRADSYARAIGKSTAFGLIARTTRIPDWLADILKAACHAEPSDPEAEP